MLKIFFSLVLSIFDSTEKHCQRNHVRKIGTKKKKTGITSMFLKNAV